MDLLTVIWSAVIVLSAIALAWMTGLILMRIVHASRAARRLHDRRQVEAALIGVIQGRSDIGAAFAPYRGRARLLAETLLDFMSLVRGEDRHIVVSALEHMGPTARSERG
ncbi:hypothetical protein [Phenylobacterium sp. J367]|uniref:hypothetical protein n=1 Tax=Phenylobacterium sp. J367 TaxID=2898435 RepID=UPI002150BFE1|nr:hypothetical protein [Phenylobacterium sp. J367]MCR5879723.1 hypothetical protein [Phenylobacterium sp. J367]